jgi:hypothetical protein
VDYRLQDTIQCVQHRRPERETGIEPVTSSLGTAGPTGSQSQTLDPALLQYRDPNREPAEASPTTWPQTLVTCQSLQFRENSIAAGGTERGSRTGWPWTMVTCQNFAFMERYPRLEPDVCRFSALSKRIDRKKPELTPVVLLNFPSILFE